MNIIKNKNILVVDDDPNLLKLAEYFLKEEYCFVYPVDTEEKAITLLEGMEFDAVLLDVMLGEESNGYDICQKITKIDKTLPVILVTALADDNSLQKGFEVGAIDYIKKPFTKIELLSRLNNVLKIKESEKKITSLYNNVIKELNMASRVQEFILPPPVIIEKNVFFSSLYHPSNEVGGDLFGIKKINEDKYIIYIGDVSGHGVNAALLMAAVKSIIDLILDKDDPDIEPHSIIGELNKIICNELLNEHYLTFFMGVVNIKEGKIKYYNAGHPLPLKFNKKTFEVEIFNDKNGGIPIGWNINYDYSKKDQMEISFSEDEIVLIYTDGVFDCSNKKMDSLGLDGLLNIIKQIRTDFALPIPYLIHEDIKTMGFTDMIDDFTLLTFQHKERNKSNLLCTSTTIDDVSLFIDKIKNKVFEISKDQEFSSKIELAATEFVNNIILHGNSFKLKHIILEILEENNELILNFFDWGKKWDFPKNKDFELSLQKKAEQYSPSGRGVDIILKLTSRIERKRSGGMNTTSLRFNF